MNIGNSNNTDKVSHSPEVGANEASVAGTVKAASIVDTKAITHVNDAMFSQIAELAVINKNFTVEKDQSLIDKTIQGKVIDLSSYVPVMRTAKLNLMESGNLILSMYNGQKMFNHLMTPKERSFISDVLSNPNLEDGQKLNKVTSLVSGIAMSTQMSYNFDKGMSPSESHSMHR